MIKIAYRINDKSKDQWIIPNRLETNFGFTTFNGFFDHILGYGKRRSPFCIKDVFDCKKDTFMGMQSTSSMFDEKKYGFSINHKYKNGVNLKKIWFEAFKSYSRLSKQNVHLLNEKDYKWNLFGLPLQPFEEDLMTKEDCVMMG
jgi:hypothetical protein